MNSSTDSSVCFLQQRLNPTSSSSQNIWSPDLPTALSTLQQHIHLSQRASTLLPLNAPGLVPCPFNPHHHVPPESLFRHSLLCPSPLDLDHDLDSLLYPHTLSFSAQSLYQKPFLQTSQNSGAELCFSFEDYGDFGSSFLYRDCPGVVSSSSSSEQDSAKNTFALPEVLWAECANVVGSGDREINCFGVDSLKLLASDFLAIRSEVDSWNDYPYMYSYVVLRAIMCRRMIKGCDFKRWVIVNSSHYGVVIDMAMRDHIHLLFRLSLKAILSEAFCSADVVMNRDVKEQTHKMSLKSMRFKCPVLVEVMKWLGSQLSVLYGEANGKLFGINMLKQSLLASASVSLLIPMELKAMDPMTSTEANLSKVNGVKLGEPFENRKQHGLGETATSEVIFVCQVAAAVAALHERALLEEKIKALRLSQSRTKYQILAEHADVSKRAEEERQKRSNYRSILEHDGLNLQRLHIQETCKSKTREELLAEERDYKRRRMSYHGRKLKRTTTQVMRDIIDEYMDGIARAGRIGSFVMGAEDGRTLSSEGHFVRENSVDADKQRRILEVSADVNTTLLHGYRKKSNSNVNTKSFKFVNSFSKDYEQQKQDSHGPDDHLEDYPRRIGRDRCDRYNTRNLDISSNHAWSDDRADSKRERDDARGTRYNHRRDSYDGSRSSDSGNDLLARKDNWKLETKDARQRNAYGSHRSNSVRQNGFDDRYDPSESQDDTE